MRLHFTWLKIAWRACTSFVWLALISSYLKRPNTVTDELLHRLLPKEIAFNRKRRRFTHQHRHHRYLLHWSAVTLSQYSIFPVTDR